MTTTDAVSQPHAASTERTFFAGMSVVILGAVSPPRWPRSAARWHRRTAQRGLALKVP